MILRFPFCLYILDSSHGDPNDSENEDTTEDNSGSGATSKGKGKHVNFEIAKDDSSEEIKKELKDTIVDVTKPGVVRVTVNINFK